MGWPKLGFQVYNNTFAYPCLEVERSFIILLKDNFDTFDVPTTGGSVALAGSIPPDDAFVVQKFRDAGAVILGKTEMDEFAISGSGYSSLGGQTLNPYQLNRQSGGSSGGTGANTVQLSLKVM